MKLFYCYLKNQTGALPLVVLVALLGLISFIAVASSFPLKDNLYSALFPKANTNANDIDIAYESHYNPFGDPWSTKLSANPDIPIALTTGCYRRGPKLNTDPNVSDKEIQYLAKSNVPFIFEECASLLGPNPQAGTNKQRLINLATKLKQVNPNAKYIGYHVFWDVNFDGDMGRDIWSMAESDQMCGSVKCETFFVHKKGLPPTRANRITGARTFDITNPNFRQYIIPKVVQSLNEMNMDGFLADGVAPTIPGINMAEVPDTIAANWGNSWAELFKEVKAAIGPNKYVFANSGGKGIAFSQTLITPEAGTGKARADGIMWEDPLGSLALDLKSSGRLNELNTFHSVAANLNKYLMIVVNTNVNCTNASGQPVSYCFYQTNKQREQNFAQYYLAAHLNTFKNNKTMLIYYTPLTTSPQFDSETFFRPWDLKIGQPTSGLQEVSQGVFLRTFQKAHVYLNNTYSNFSAPSVGLYNLDGTPASNPQIPAKSGRIFITQQLFQEWNVPQSPTPSPTPSSTPPTGGVPIVVTTSMVSKLESTAKANYFNYFYTTKANEITFLLSRTWRKVSDAVFHTPIAGSANALPVYRMYKLDATNGIQIATWALNTTDRTNLKNQGFSEYDEKDFYAYPTQYPGSVGVTRMKYNSTLYNRTFFELAKNQTEITALQQNGWQIDTPNVFYVFLTANPVIGYTTPAPTPTPSPTATPVVTPSATPSITKPEIISSKSFSYCNNTIPRNHLEWVSVPNGIAYKIFRETVIPGSGIKIGETSGTGLNDDNSVPATQYTYFIEAVLSNGTSVVSSPYKITTVSCTVATPTPTPTVIPVVKVDVKRLDKQPKTNYFQKFFTSKSNEITFLLSRGWGDAGVVFKSPAVGTSDALMAKRMVYTDSANGAQIITWAVNSSDINELKSLGFSEINDGDFYAFTTQKTETVGVTRMKYYSPTYNRTFYTFAKNSIEINALTSQGWTVQKSNVFYVYP